MVTVHDGKAIVECSICGPVAVSDFDKAPAALAHLAPVHGVTEIQENIA